MEGKISTLSVSPRIGVLLSQVAETPDLETALWEILADYIDLKMEFLKQRIQKFESKWKMTFEEFSERGQNGKLGQDAYTYEVESDFWEWEQAETLLQHYRVIQAGMDIF